MVKPPWSISKDSVSATTPILQLTCVKCGKHFERRRWVHNVCMKKNQGRGPYCSRVCALYGRKVSVETRQKSSASQKGVSVLSRGREGHTVSEAVRQKIRKSKTGLPSKKDWDVVAKEKELHKDKIKRSTMLHRLIPDIIFIDNEGKFCAIEVEKEVWETGIRQKMKAYKDITNFDKVILVWYLPTGERMKEWVLENGVWTLTS